MAKKILRYQGGDNIQTLGHIQFDSNSTRKDKQGNLIAKDLKSGKDYGVVRRDDGSYDFYRPQYMPTVSNKSGSLQTEPMLPPDYATNRWEPLPKTGFKAVDALYDNPLLSAFIPDALLRSKAYDAASKSGGAGHITKEILDGTKDANYNGSNSLESVDLPKKFLYPKESAGLFPSKYRPSSLTNVNKDLPFYSVEGENLLQPDKTGKMYNPIGAESQKIKNLLIGEAMKLEGNIGTNLNLGHYTSSAGRDSTGTYLSAYDIWDFQPKDYGKAWGTVGGSSLPQKQAYLMQQLGTPFAIYDRMYVDPNTLHPLEIKENERAYKPFYTEQNMKKKKYVKGGFLGQEGSSVYGDAIGQGLGAVANQFVPGAGAILQLQTGLNKFGMAQVDKMGPQAGNIALGTDARAAYDSEVDSGAANVLRNFSGIPGIGGMLGAAGTLIDYFKRKNGGGISSAAGYQTGGDLNTGSNYSIKRGDTLGEIARKYNVSVGDLARYNNIENVNKIKSGAALVIPANANKFSEKELIRLWKQGNIGSTQARRSAQQASKQPSSKQSASSPIQETKQPNTTEQMSQYSWGPNVNTQLASPAYEPYDQFAPDNWGLLKAGLGYFAAGVAPAFIPTTTYTPATNLLPSGMRMIEGTAQVAKGFATGGDVQLSSNSTLIQGNPNVTDGNQYGNVALDHNEVVNNNRVFSDKLFDELSKKTFAEAAKRTAKSTGKAERRLSGNPHDVLSSNTIRQNSMIDKQLFDRQERLASSLGLRNPDGSTVQKMAYGGTPKRGTPEWFGAMDQMGNGMSTPFYNTGQYVDSYTNPYTGNPVASTNDIPYDMPSGPVTPFDKLPTRNNYTSVGIPSGVDPFTGQPSDNPTVFRGIDAPARTAPDLNKLNPFDNVKPTDPQTSNGIRQQFTTGDSLQLAELFAKFRGLGQPHEQAPLYQDMTNISRNYYRPDMQLLDNSNSYNQAVRGIDTNSANTFNALQSNMLASKFKADNSVRSNTSQMNRGAQIDFENRTSNQTRYNLSQKLQRDTINAQNEGAYDARYQNAATSLGNFGQSLNNKKQAYDTLRTYKDMYPNVNSHIEEYLKSPEGMDFLKKMFK